MIVTLIGYRGCGKSSVGPLLASRLGCRCIDSDDVIEQRAARSIADIFAEEGEPGFRQLETEVLADLLADPPSVIAAGGGAILAQINRSRMQQAGPVVWLNASPQVLAARIAGDAGSATRRPSLTGTSVLEEVAAVLESRQPLYSAAATLMIDADNATPEQIADLIFTQLSATPPEASS